MTPLAIIANVVLVAIVLIAIVGLLGLAIRTSMPARKPKLARSKATRARRVPASSRSALARR